MADFKNIEEIKELCVKALNFNPNWNGDYCVILARPVYLFETDKLRKTEIQVLALNSIYFFKFPIGEEALAEEVYKKLQKYIKNLL